MKELFIEYINNFWLLLNAIGVYILIGVLIAGLIKQFLPDSYIRKHLGQPGFMSNIKAAILGIPLPLCSCSVIPFIGSLKKSGATPSSVQTFLIATPITGADSILATYGVFGWFFTIYRIISSVVIALIAGLLTQLFTRNQFEQQEQPPVKQNFKPIDIPIITEGQAPESKLYRKTKAVFAYGLDDILKDISKPFLIGVFLATLLVTVFPEDFSQYISKNAWLNYLLVILLAAPLYVCATASIPLGIALISAGFSPGAAFIFLTAGPATNLVTMSVIIKTLGKSVWMIYLVTVILGSLLFGIVLDTFFADSLMEVLSFQGHDEELGFISQVSSVILLYLVIKYTINPNAKVVGSAGCG